MPAYRMRPDDDIRRVRNVWLGPKGITWPVQATYTAWGLFVVTLVILLVFEAVTPMRVSIIPTWEIAISMVLATVVTGALDYDKPLSMLPRVMLQHLASPRRRATTRTYKPTLRVRVKTRENT